MHKNKCCDPSSKPHERDSSKEGLYKYGLSKKIPSVIVEYSLLSRTVYPFLIIQFNKSRNVGDGESNFLCDHSKWKHAKSMG